ncbi:hypothetical protein TREES_T100014211 [Tupaia chinensis]|uniref:Uncharacterized protein n=1 Tax=Tupaia chinensis TaxID=246437 RepID=L9KL13_TUPCH|nr:hypothetical protein TREES_T100014211 [Tupaia chinensis]
MSAPLDSLLTCLVVPRKLSLTRPGASAPSPPPPEQHEETLENHKGYEDVALSQNRTKTMKTSTLTPTKPLEPGTEMQQQYGQNMAVTATRGHVPWKAHFSLLRCGTRRERHET